MPLRVTQGMEYQQAVTNIQRGYANLFGIQAQLGTGKRVKAPSDDPGAAAQILEYARRAASLGSYRKNISAGQSALDSAAQDLQALTDQFQQARERIVQGVSGTLSDADRLTIADQLDGFVTGMLGHANAHDGAGFIFAGSRSDASPFVQSVGADGIERVRYVGDDLRNQVEIAPGATEAFNIPGSRLLAVGPRGATTYGGTTGARAGAGTDSGVGRARLLVAHTLTLFGPAPGATVHAASGLRAGASSAASDTILGGSHSVSISVNAAGNGGTVSLDGGPAVAFGATDSDLAVANGAGDVVHLDLTQLTAGFTGTIALDARGTLSLDGGTTTVPIDFASAGQALINPADGSVTHVDSTGIARAGSDDLTYGGTLDVFNALLAARDLLRTTGTPQQVSAAVAKARSLLDEIDKGAEAVLGALADAGTTANRLEGLDRRMAELEVTVAARRSEVEDADYAQLLVQLNQHNVVYQASLSATAKLSSLTLANFLG